MISKEYACQGYQGTGTYLGGDETNGKVYDLCKTVKVRSGALLPERFLSRRGLYFLDFLYF